MKTQWAFYAALSLASVGHCLPPHKLKPKLPDPKIGEELPKVETPRSTIPKISAAGDPPSYVWRGDFRTPAQVEEAGGFYSHAITMELSAEEAEMASSLYSHCFGHSISNYVSATSDPRVTRRFAVDMSKPTRFGTVYKISADPKMVDTVKSLRRYLLIDLRAESEQSIVKGAPYEQVEGWYNAKDLEPFGFDRLARGEKLEHLFTRNPRFNAVKYEGLRAGGSQPQLAGFDEDSPAWDEEPWSKFKGQSVAKNMETYYRETGCGGAVNAKGLCDATTFEAGAGAEGATEATEAAQSAQAGEASGAATEESSAGEVADLVGDKDLMDQIAAGEVTEGKLFSLEAAETELASGVTEAAIVEAANAEAVVVMETLQAESIAATAAEGGEGIAIAGELLEVLGMIV